MDISCFLDLPGLSKFFELSGKKGVVIKHMKTLRYGDSGPSVQLLQTALIRSGNNPGEPDGAFGWRTESAVRSVQRASALAADGIAGPQTQRVLMPYLLGYSIHRIRSGDTLYRMAMMYGTTIKAIETANPGLNPLRLQLGSSVVVPFSFDVVPTNIAMCSSAISYCVRGLVSRYPFMSLGEAGRSVMGHPIYYISLGSGPNRVLYNASHHANEWITTTLLLKFMEELAKAYASGGAIYGMSAGQLLGSSTVRVIPAVNPDGIDLVTGDLKSGGYYESARALAQYYPDIPFPSGWKANIRGIDLNLQYPAGWERARQIKFAQGFNRPGPRDYVGASPVGSAESKAMYSYTRSFDPALTLSYHSQGEVIYWKYSDREPPHSREIARRFGAVSGYAVEETPYASGFAGYKDWFIQDYDRPGYTVEVGLGENPLPISQFDRIYSDNVGILALGTTLGA